MNDYLPVILALAFGFLLGRAIPDSLWFRVTYTISRNTPRPCAKCGRWHQTRHLKSARMLWTMNRKDQTALICQPCYDIEFRPWSAVIGKDKNDPTKPA